MSGNGHRMAADIRSHLDHPVIDGDGHWVEFDPVFSERMGKVCGDKARNGFNAAMKTTVDSLSMTVAERKRRRVAQTQRPDKHLYRSTKAGTQALRDWLATAPITEAPSRNVLLLKLFFGDLAPPEVLLEQVAEARREAEERRTDLLAIESRARELPDDEFAALTRRYGFEHADAIIRWAEAAERELRAKLE